MANRSTKTRQSVLARAGDGWTEAALDQFALRGDPRGGGARRHVQRIYFVDLGAYELGATRVLSLTAWAAAQGVPAPIGSQFEPPGMAQSAAASTVSGQ